MSNNELESRLAALVRTSPDLMAMLYAARELDLASWCIGAGAVRALVWDHLHGRPPRIDSDADVDLAFHDDAAGPGFDAACVRRLSTLMPSVAWELTNQATVHHWFLSQYGQVVQPVDSLADGIATWPEYATCVGVTLNADESVGVIAPHGLDDLFALRLRHNPLRASAAVFRERVSTKRWAERWPLLDIAPAHMPSEP